MNVKYLTTQKSSRKQRDIKMKINTLSQNNPAFGVRMSIKEATIPRLKQQLSENPHLARRQKNVGIYKLIYDKIIKTNQKNLSFISFFHSFCKTTTIQTEKLNGLLEQNRKSLELAFWETCDKFFDVQLVANDEDKNIDNISNDGIKEASYLTRIFYPLESNRKNKKPIIEYCIKNYSKAKNNQTELCKEIKIEFNPDMKVPSIRNNILSPILRLPKYYNNFKNATQKEEQTFTKFKEYLKEKAPSDNIKLYNSGNGELLAYTIETFKKYPDFKEKFVFAEDTIANTNTIGKEKKKRATPKQIYEDVVNFIDYCIANPKLTVKSIHLALFKANNISNSTKDHVSLLTLSNWQTTINQIKEILEKYPNKKDEEIMNDLRNKYHSSKNCILSNDELFLQVLTKLRTLNKTTNCKDTANENDIILSQDLAQQGELSTNPSFQDLEQQKQLSINLGFQNFEQQKQLSTNPGFQDLEQQEQLSTNPGFQNFEQQEQLSTNPGFQDLEQQEQLSTNPGFQDLEQQGNLSINPGFQDLEQQKQLSINLGFQDFEQQGNLFINPVFQDFEQQGNLFINPVFQDFEQQEQLSINPSFQDFEQQGNLFINPVFQDLEQQEQLSNSSQPQTNIIRDKELVYTVNSQIETVQTTNYNNCGIIVFPRFNNKSSLTRSHEDNEQSYQNKRSKVGTTF